MVRRGQRDKQELRRAERSTLQELRSPHGRYEPPNRADCHLKQWEFTRDSSDVVALQYVLWRYNGRLVDFIVNVRTLEPNRWTSVERFDCCHGHCHHHSYGNDSEAPPSERSTTSMTCRGNSTRFDSSPMTGCVLFGKERERDMSSMEAELDAFRTEVDFHLGIGAPADMELPVTRADGTCPVVVALDDEPLSVLLSRLHAMGGIATVFVKGKRSFVSRR